MPTFGYSTTIVRNMDSIHMIVKILMLTFLCRFYCFRYLRETGQKKELNKKIYFLRIIQFSEKIYKNILAPNLLDPKLTRAKLFETERTRQLACLPSFCELVFCGGVTHVVIPRM